MLFSKSDFTFCLDDCGTVFGFILTLTQGGNLDYEKKKVQGLKNVEQLLIVQKILVHIKLDIT